LRWQEPNANNVYFNEKNSGIKHLIYNIVMAKKKKKNYSIDVMIIILKRAQRKTPLVFFSHDLQGYPCRDKKTRSVMQADA
jgi:hypothetical protein